MNNPPIIFLMGPTASGKTDLAIELVQQMPAEIISVDSAMVYRGMDIGTGKPSKAQLAKAPHHLIDIREIDQPYSAADFAKDALVCIEDIQARGKIPLLVGGTMLYFRALEQGLSPLPSANAAVREKLLKEAQDLGWAALHARLEKIDPSSAKRIHPNDPQRIQRALEVYEITEKTMSSFFENEDTANETLQQALNVKSFAIIPDDGITAQIVIPAKAGIQRDFQNLDSRFRGNDGLLGVPGLLHDRKILHERIEKRFYEMLEKGLVKEVEGLLKGQEANFQLPAFRAVGYRQVAQYLRGEYDKEEMVKRALGATRQLAKRQLTWLRSLPNIKLLSFDYSASLQTMLHCLFL